MPRKALFRLVSLSLAAALSALSPLVVIPVVSGEFGVPGWTSVAVGQSIGAGAAVLLSFGWSLAGPVAIVGQGRMRRTHILRNALSSQLMVAAVVIPAASAIAYVVAPAFQTTALLTAAVTGIFGMLPGWYFLGTKSASRYLAFYTAPQVVGAVLGALLLLVSNNLVVLPIVQLAVVAAWLELVLWVETRSMGIPRKYFSVGNIRRTLRKQFSLGSTQVASAVYINLPVAIFAASTPIGLAVFSGGDRLYRFALTALNPLTQTFQTATLHQRGPAMHRSMRKAVATHAGVGLVAGGGFLLVVEPVSRLLYSGTLHIPFNVAALYAACIVVVMITRSLGANVLAVLRAGRVMMISSSLAAVVALVAIPVLAVRFGAIGGVAAVLIAETVVLVGFLWGILRYVQSRRCLTRRAPLIGRA